MTTAQDPSMFLDSLCGVDGIAILYLGGHWEGLKVSEAKQRQ